MPIKCPACAEENPDGAIICELCQAVLRPLGPRTEAPRPAPRAPVSHPPAAVPSTPSVPSTNRPLTPTALPTDKLLAFHIPEAPARRGRGGMIAGVIAGAALALAAVALMRTKPQPNPPAASTVMKTEVVYVQVPSAAPAQPNKNQDAPPVPTTVPSPPAGKAETPPPPAAPAVEASKRPQQMMVRYHGQDARTQRILVPITVNGSTTVMMALDTGAPSTIISQSLAERLGVLRKDDGVLLTSASGIGGSAPAVLVVLDSLALGEARDEFVPATVTGDLSDSFAGLLGMDFITTFKLKVDAARQVIILTKPDSGGNTPAGHDERWWRRLFQQFKDQRRLWESYRDFVDKRVGESEISAGPSIDRLRRLQTLTVSQVDEAGKLLQRLERHASNHAVPREWR